MNQNEPTNKSPLEYIAEHLSEEDLLCQIAEEASELAQAALKRRRAITQTNPTPTTPEAAMADIIEEYGDVMNAMEAYLFKNGLCDSTILKGFPRLKLVRWAKRIKEKLEDQK